MIGGHGQAGVNKENVMDEPSAKKRRISPRGGGNQVLKKLFEAKSMLNSTSTLLNSSMIDMHDSICEVFDSVTDAAAETKNTSELCGLPEVIGEILENERGITKLYDWQKECLKMSLTNVNKNLIYTSPTSGGKTLVAELSMLNTILNGFDVVLVLPYVSLVEEKVRLLIPFALHLDFTIEHYSGSKGKFPPRSRAKRRSLYIATIEKFNHLMNFFLKNPQQIGLIIVDEIHMLGEGRRGGLLETALMKTMLAKRRIIGMSATLSNLNEIAKFLNDALIYVSETRPTELTEFVYIRDSRRLINIATKRTETYVGESDPLHHYITEIVDKGGSVLVFCPTKKSAASNADRFCRVLTEEHQKTKAVSRKKLIDEITTEANGEICQILGRTLKYGVAYHHSGMTSDERRLLEDAYLNANLCVFFATTTLAAGVNLPAARVIILSTSLGYREQISCAQYRQMIGRAGRTGLCNSGGDSIIFSDNGKEYCRVIVPTLLQSGGGEAYCSSTLFAHKDVVRQFCLDLLCLGVVTIPPNSSSADLKNSFRSILRTSLSFIQSSDNIDAIIDSIDIDNSMIDHGGKVTPFAEAIFNSNLSIEVAQLLRSDLRVATKNLILDSVLHLLFLSTPYDDVIKVDHDFYMNQFDTLSEPDKSVARVFGVNEATLFKLSTGANLRKTHAASVNRFYHTLILRQLWKGHDVFSVARAFAADRGSIQQFQLASSSFQMCVLRFAQSLNEFWALADLLANFSNRLSTSLNPEIALLIDIPGVKMARAKQLFAAGYSSLALLVQAKANEMVEKVPFLSIRSAQGIINAASTMLAAAYYDKIDDLQNLISPSAEASGRQNETQILHP